MVKGNAGLSEEVENAVLEAMDRLGPGAFSPNDIVVQFLGRGVSRSTLFRWANAVLASGKPGQHLAMRVKEAATERAARTPDPAADAAREAPVKLPAAVRVEDVTGFSAIKIIEHLQECVRAARDVMQHARHEDGKVRNSRLLLAASERLRRSLETEVRLFGSLRSAQRVDQFHDEIIGAIAAEAPQTAERLLVRLGQISANLGGIG